ncbi:hypothetical protein FB451DRAFT_1186852 [Mycena latifolia]|nr:hypothetical protein FB451DRAFT_1186852 [Mycena latifolia]
MALRKSMCRYNAITPWRICCAFRGYADFGRPSRTLRWWLLRTRGVPQTFRFDPLFRPVPARVELHLAFDDTHTNDIADELAFGDTFGDIFVNTVALGSFLYTTMAVKAGAIRAEEKSRILRRIWLQPAAGAGARMGTAPAVRADEFIHNLMDDCLSAASAFGQNTLAGGTFSGWAVSAQVPQTLELQRRCTTIYGVGTTKELVRARAGTKAESAGVALAMQRH